MAKLAYLACPYTAVGPDAHIIHNDRVEAADFYTAELMRQRHYAVFSPISHGHRIAQHLPLPLVASHDFWMQQCFPMLRRVDELVILPIPGWRESKGVQLEIAFARDLYIPITIIQARGFNVEDISSEELHNNHWREVCL